MFADVIASLSPMPADGWATLGVLLALFALLLATSLPVDMVFMGALALLLVAGVVEPDVAFAGFGSPALFTVGALYVVVAGLQETGALKWISGRVLGAPRGRRGALIRLTGPVAFVSAFMNNTPVVALFIPVVQDWCRKTGFSATRFLIPLSYASILGGMCTLIGTSTNLVVNSLYLTGGAEEGLSLFSVTRVGLPCALLGLVYLVLAGPRLLPDREVRRSAEGVPRNFTVELEVLSSGGLEGKTPAAADLAALPDATLLEVIRDGHGLDGPPADTELAVGDHLLYSGTLQGIQRLQRENGLRLTASRFFPADAPGKQRQLVEAVVSHTCPLVGRTLKQGRFRELYNAVVVAIARNGEQIRGSLKRVPLKAGDVLLIECHAGFIPRQVDSGDFYLLNALDATLQKAPGHRAPVALAVLLAMLALVGADLMSMLKASLLAAGIMLFTGCCSASTARRKIDWNVLMVIGAALGLGGALQASGAAGVLAELLMGLSGGRPWVALALVYLTTVFFTEMITNNAAVALVFPVAMDAATRLGVSPLPFLFCVMIAGSASFATPIGYQTNLMVYGAGNYRFSDYIRVGVPLGLIVGATTLALAPLVWPF